MNKKKILVLLITGIIACSAVSGCGTSETEEESVQNTSEETSVISDVSLLESGQVYVCSDGLYYPLCSSEATFDMAEDDSETSDDKTIWFSEDDWENVPTLYEGDTLVYRYDEDLDETFYIERFEYVGWTFGVANLTQTITGRYSYSGDDTDDLDASSSAINLLTLGEYTLILDKVGGVELRSGNVTRGGLIIGLEKGMTYEVEAYIGTNLNILAITADRIALTSMADYETTDYEFLQSTIVEIHLPELKDGYYSVNGSGIFRLVNGSSWDEDTDFNEEDEEDTGSTDEAEDETDDTADEEASSEAGYDYD